MTKHSRRCLWTVIVSSVVFVGTALYMMYGSLLDGSGLTVDELDAPLSVLLVSAAMFVVAVLAWIEPPVDRWLTARLKGCLRRSDKG